MSQVDLGYVGIIKDYLCKHIAIPHKKSKTKPLTDSQKGGSSRFRGAATRCSIMNKGIITD